MTNLVIISTSVIVGEFCKKIFEGKGFSLVDNGGGC